MVVEFLFSYYWLQTYLDVLFNSWYKDFYDILQTAEDRDISEFWNSIEKFLYIALPYVTLLLLPIGSQDYGHLGGGHDISYMPYWRLPKRKWRVHLKEFRKIV